MTHSPKVARRGLFNRSGVTAVEFALTFPLLFMFTMAAFELSRMSIMRNFAQDAAYDACRFCMVEGATAAEAVQKAQEVLALVGAQGYTVTVNNGQELSTDSENVEVTISIPMEDNVLITSFLCKNRFINSTIVLNKERYVGYYDAAE